jgi:DNA-binding GntR family transcriptional regulator
MKRASQRRPRASEDANGRNESVKRSQVIYEQLKKYIITGAIQRGESLTETQLAVRFQCSQAPVREACIALLYEGFLTTTPYKGFAVSEITLKEIKNLYEVRLLVECAAAEAAAGVNGASPAMIDEIENSIRVLQEGPADLWRFLCAEVGFHLAIAKACDNELLEKFVNLVWGRFQQFYYKTVPMRQGRVELDSVNEHTAILEAIREHDPEKARTLMHQHILLGRETALKLYFGL